MNVQYTYNAHSYTRMGRVLHTYSMPYTFRFSVGFIAMYQTYQSYPYAIRQTQQATVTSNIVPVAVMLNGGH